MLPTQELKQTNTLFVIILSFGSQGTFPHPVTDFSSFMEACKFGPLYPTHSQINLQGFGLIFLLRPQAY